MDLRNLTYEAKKGFFLAHVCFCESENFFPHQSAKISLRGNLFCVVLSARVLKHLNFLCRLFYLKAILAMMYSWSRNYIIETFSLLRASNPDNRVLSSLGTQAKRQNKLGTDFREEPPSTRLHPRLQCKIPSTSTQKVMTDGSMMHC